MNTSAKPFYVDSDLCTGCGECWTNMPDVFKNKGNDVADVISTNVKDITKLQETIDNCPGTAILWK